MDFAAHMLLSGGSICAAHKVRQEDTVLNRHAFFKRLCRLIVSSIVSVAMTAATVLIFPLSADADEAAVASATAEVTMSDTVPYSEYIDRFRNAAYPDSRIVLSAENAMIPTAGTARILRDYPERTDAVIYTDETGEVSWTVTVPESGLYTLLLEYHPEGNGVGAIERQLTIDGQLPFSEAQRLSFPRLWSNSGEDIQYDTQGNQILIEQVEVSGWAEQYAIDPSGLWQGPLQFYLSAGQHTVCIAGVLESMVIGRLSFESVSDTAAPTYTAAYAAYPEKARVSPDAVVLMQGEDADVKSTQMLFPLADKTSPTVEPYSSSKIVYNTIGGNQWTNAGQWAQWSFYAPENGLYALSAHFKQALKNSSASIREIQIDGSTPFSEATGWQFPYASVWQTEWFADSAGTPFEFYLEKGWHTLRLTVGLGEYTEIISRASQYLNELNGIYRSIIAIAGANPDRYRDYKFDQMIPEVIEQMQEMSQNLRSLEQQVMQIDGRTRSVADIKRLYTQLDMMLEDTDTIAVRLTSYKDTIASFGTWINTQRGQPLELDWLRLSSADAALPQGEAGFFSLVSHYLKGFAYSFVADYESIGQINVDADASIKVWMTTSQDQAQLLRQIIISDFTPQSGIAAEVQLVSTRALLPAILADKGPDVSLGMLAADVNNLALRDAVYDLSTFSDATATYGEFFDYAINTFRFNDGLYALPETQTWAMLFYRKDILQELDIQPEELGTWDSVLNSVLPKLKKNSLAFGILPTIQNYLPFLYQTDGWLYTADGKCSGLAESEAIESMKLFTMLYKQYGVPIAFDFANRFRTGEMPIAVTDFTAYNTLTLFASEIKGLWGMQPVPGTVQADGTVNHTAVATVNGSVILKGTDQPDASWTFLKWWTSARTQDTFGRRLEAVVGTSSRYNTANMQAIRQVQWDPDMRNSMLFQAENLKEYPQVPGGYFSERLFNFAYRDIVYNDMDVRESLSSVAENINREMKNKREEYGLE